MFQKRKTTLQFLVPLGRNGKQTMLRRWLIFAVAVILVVGGVGLAPTGLAAKPFDREHGEADLGPGCAPERPAIAHHAGGVIVDTNRDENAPIPCVTNTGFRTSEPSIVVTNEGTVLFQPALTPGTGLPIGVLRSVTRGASWEFINPSTNPPRTTAIDMNMWVDRQTGRVFWSNDLIPPVGGAVTQRMDLSDDDGRTWFPSSPHSMLYDHTQIFSGPPPKSLKHLMQGYPNVVYAVVSGGFTCAARNFCGTHITRSLDGGLTFGPPVALPYPPECPAPGVGPTGGYGLNGVVDRHGTVYVPFTPCERPYIAISHDAGDTWQLVLVANTETIGWGELGLGMDKAGKLYAAWTAAADRLLYLAISRDRGLHWGTPLMIGAPGVREAAIPVLVAGKRGQVAVTYYGSKNAPLPFPQPCTGVSISCPGYEHETWDTYITETFNALASQPLFWSATLNDPAHPTWYGVTPSSMRVDSGFATGSSAMAQRGPTFAGRLDYYSMTMAPDFTPWVGFAQECPNGRPVLGNPNCNQAAGGLTDGLWGMVGRLVRVREEVDDHDRDDQRDRDDDEAYGFGGEF